MSDDSKAPSSKFPKNIEEFRAKSPFKQEYISKRDHDAAELHLIGDALPMPTQIKKCGALLVGSVGTSPIAAREDHVHAGGVTVGTILMYGGSIDRIPGEYFLCDGRAISRAAYGELFYVISTNWGVGNGSTTFNIPDFINFFPYGSDVPGITGGSADSVVVSHQHAGLIHDHGVSVSNDGIHTHKIPGRPTPNAAGAGFARGSGTIATDIETTTNPAPQEHTHTVNIIANGTDNTHSTGVSGVNKNIPPYKGVLFIIKASVAV